MSGFFTLSWIDWGDATDFLLGHLATALPAIVLSFVISIPIGWAVNRLQIGRATRAIGSIILVICALLYAIPSLPLFVVLPTIIGTDLQSPINVVIGLTLYGIALMVRTTADGLAAVDPDVRQSATAMGFSGVARFFRVELPLAGPVLVAGLRVVSVSTISLTTVGAVLGTPSLGRFFTGGFQTNTPIEVWIGVVVTIAIALILDGVIVLVSRLLMPWSRASGTRARRAGRRAVLA